jgi:hypothetical protein
LLLLALGSGLGFSVVSPWRGSPDITTTRAALFGGIFMAVTAVMASALGGYVTGRLGTRRLRTPVDEVFFRDTAHGLLCWAVAIVMGAVLVASAATVIAGGAPAGAGQGATERTDATDPLLDRLLRPNYATLTGGTGQPAGGAFAAGRDLAADRDVARRMLAGLHGTLSPDDRAYLAEMVAARTGLLVGVPIPSSSCWRYSGGRQARVEAPVPERRTVQRSAARRWQENRPRFVGQEQ